MVRDVQLLSMCSSSSSADMFRGSDDDAGCCPFIVPAHVDGIDNGSGRNSLEQ